MRIKHYSVLIGLTVLISLCFLSLSPKENIEYVEWNLEWMDDFKGKTLDTTVWSIMERHKDGGCRNYITSNPACYDLANGILKIKAIKNDVDPNDTASYLTGGIYTKFKKSFPPGRLDVRARFNGSKGKTCGIWLLPFKIENGWPSDGEIDIMEHASNIGYITQTVHTAFTKTNLNAKPSRFIKHEIDYENFNVYGAVFLEDKIEFFINGVKTMTYPKVDSLINKGQFPFNRDWYLLLSTASRGPFDSVCSPLEMQIDWVKYYRKKQQ